MHGTVEVAVEGRVDFVAVFTLLVFIATVALAVATAMMVRVSSKALRATIRPWLTRTNKGIECRVVDQPLERAADVFLLVRNVGAGLAMIEPRGVHLSSSTLGPLRRSWRRAV